MIHTGEATARERVAKLARWENVGVARCGARKQTVNPGAENWFSMARGDKADKVGHRLPRTANVPAGHVLWAARPSIPGAYCIHIYPVLAKT